MHAKFNLNPGREKWSEYMSIGESIHGENKKIVKNKLDEFKSANGVLQAEGIIKNWFPKIHADVFLSHSHKDEQLITGLAGWLKYEFQITSFIDSAVWGYADNLLRVIDDNFCKKTSDKYYNYNLRNRSTSHVHMLLSTALFEMIDRCECIIFVNTPNSFVSIDSLNKNGKTESPWIYSEIAMTRLIRQRSPADHRPKMAMDSVGASLEDISESRQLRISYPADLFHLTELSEYDLTCWKNKENLNRSKYPLDSLYEMKRVKNVN